MGAVSYCCAYAEWQAKTDPFSDAHIPDFDDPQPGEPCYECLRQSEQSAAATEAWMKKLARLLPPVLAKACTDSFDYVIGIRDGSTVRFESAGLSEDGGWLTLNEVKSATGPIDMWDTRRGVDVAVSEILWAVDAPEGS